MNIIDCHRGLETIGLAVPAARTASANGTATDITRYKGVMKVTLYSAAGTGTSPTMNVKVQTGDASDGSDAVDIPGAAFAQVTNASASLQSLAIDTRACKKFIRVVFTIGGTSPSFTCTVVATGQPNVV